MSHMPQIMLSTIIYTGREKFFNYSVYIAFYIEEHLFSTFAPRYQLTQMTNPSVTQ